MEISQEAFAADSLLKFLCKPISSIDTSMNMAEKKRLDEGIPGLELGGKGQESLALRILRSA
jgi:hypothetical protein